MKGGWVVIGALIGTQQGREIEIINSFELALSNNGQDVNHDFFTTRQNQCETTYHSCILYYQRLS